MRHRTIIIYLFSILCFISFGMIPIQAQDSKAEVVEYNPVYTIYDSENKGTGGGTSYSVNVAKGHEGQVDVMTIAYHSKEDWTKSQFMHLSPGQTVQYNNIKSNGKATYYLFFTKAKRECYHDIYRIWSK